MCNFKVYMSRLFLAAGLLFAVCFFHPVHGKAQGVATAITMPADILRYVNEYRAGKGLGPLQMNDYASLAAAKHSRDMATGNVPFGHDGFDERMARVTRQVKPANAWAE